MTIYIRATGNISPQKTFGHPPLLSEPVEYFGNRLACIEPDYKEIIDAKLLRRMSRIIRMGVAAAKECLQEAKLTMPDAIVTGTSYGCLEDTGLFLSKMIEYKEELLAPTAFIQSTHNTIGAQIGLMLQCNNYNNAFVHRGFSFESALLDGIMLLKEKEMTNVLVGAIDEITDYSHAILTRLSLYRKEPSSSFDLFTSNENSGRPKGSIGGEGSAFFLLASEESDTDYAKLDALKTFYKPKGVEEIENHILSFLSANSIALKDIDLIITGKNGDARYYETFYQLEQGIFRGRKLVNYKNLCGEYPTATAFALWMAANIIKSDIMPSVLGNMELNETKVKRILIYDHYLGIHHTLLMVSAC